jgi:hypothetical protein
MLALHPEAAEPDGRTELLRRSWEEQHPERAAAFTAWAESRTGPPPGLNASWDPPRAQPVLGEWKPLDGRLTAILVVFGAIVVFDLVSMASELMEIRLLERVRDGGAYTDDELSSNDLRVGLLAIVQMLLYIAGAVVWIRWFHRAYQNTAAVPGGVRRHGTGWAIGGWFVPILALFRPKEIANDLWASGAREDEPTGPPPLLLVWWLGYLISQTLSQIAFRVLLEEDSADGLITADKLYMASEAIDVVIAVLACRVAVRITQRMQARRDEALSRPAPAAAPPA